MKPLLHSGLSSASLMRPTTISSDTSAPDSIAFLACISVGGGGGGVMVGRGKGGRELEERVTSTRGEGRQGGEGSGCGRIRLLCLLCSNLHWQAGALVRIYGFAWTC